MTLLAAGRDKPSLGGRGLLCLHFTNSGFRKLCGRGNRILESRWLVVDTQNTDLEFDLCDPT